VNTVNGSPIASSSSLGDGLQVTLMALAAALLLFCLSVAPPLIAQASSRRRQARGRGDMHDTSRPGGN
jgi:hypothetical protein